MPVKIFFCYAPEDTASFHSIKAHLHLLQRQHLINIVDDRDISAGAEWEQAVCTHLDTAQIILLLISADFFKSDYCYSIGMKRALERHKRKQARVIPILVRPVLWEDTALAQLQMLPMNRKPIQDEPHQDRVFRHIAEEIKKVVQQVQVSSKSQASNPPDKGQHPVSPQPKNAGCPGPATPIRKKNNQKPHVPVVHTEKPASAPQRAYTQTNNVFQAPVQGVINGDMNTIHINAIPPASEDPTTKRRNNARRGYNALREKDYVTALHYLEAADQVLVEREEPAETAQIKYHLALTLLQGQRPFHMILTTMRRIESILRSAIKLQPLHSYYYTLALLKRDFARNGLPQDKQDAQNLKHKAQRINLTAIDRENLQILTLCQPRLINDARSW